MNIFLIFLFSAVFGGISFQMKWLTAAGSLLASLFGASLLYFGDDSWIVPVLLFFGSSSLLSKVNRANETKEDIRNGLQVLANGGVAWLLLLANAEYPQSMWYCGFAGALAAATADTWGTEVGRLTQGKTWSIVTGKTVKRGVSGGISLQGTVAGWVGAGTIGMFAAILYGMAIESFALVILLSGAFGSLIDSVLGGAIQVRYRDIVTGAVSEKPGKTYEIAFGWRWMTNDMVNLFCTLAGALIAMIFCFYIEN